MYLASILRERYEVVVYDAEYHGETPMSLAKWLFTRKPSIVGFTATILNVGSMNECIAEVREVLPDTKIVVGGPQVTGMQRAGTLHGLDFDLAVIGECEGNIADIIGGTIGIVQGEPVKDLDDIPFPSRDLIMPPINRYKGNMPRYKMPETSVLWSRGCPHSCIFCANSVFGHRPIRYRTPENIVRELIELKEKWGVNTVFVYDDELLGQSAYQTRWVRQVLDAITDAGLHRHFTFKCQARCNPQVFSPYDLERMRAAGFKTIMWGIESGSQHVLDSIQKGITPDDVRTVFKWCKQAGIKTYAFMMVGNWGERPEDIELSKQLIADIEPDWVQWTVCTPIPPTDFYFKVRQNITVEEDRPTYFYDAITSTDTMPREQIFKAYKEIERDTILDQYKSWRYRLKLLRESLFTRRGRRWFWYRLKKYLRLKREGQI